MGNFHFDRKFRFKVTANLVYIYVTNYAWIKLDLKTEFKY